MEKRQIFWISAIIIATVFRITGCYVLYSQPFPIEDATLVMGSTFLFISEFMGACPLIGGARILWTHMYENERFYNIAYLHTPIPLHILTHMNTYGWARMDFANMCAHSHKHTAVWDTCKGQAVGRRPGLKRPMWFVGNHRPSFSLPLSPVPHLFLLSSSPPLLFHQSIILCSIVPVAEAGIGTATTDPQTLRLFFLLLLFLDLCVGSFDLRCGRPAFESLGWTTVDVRKGVFSTWRRDGCWVRVRVGYLPLLLYELWCRDKW